MIRRCRLEEADCPEAACAFWERTSCVLDRVPLDLGQRPELTRLLLALREALEAGRPSPERG